MSYITLYQSNFAQGELSPWLNGRVDIAQYANSAKSIKNMFVRPQGGLTKRPGTVYVGAIKDESSETTRLWEFVYSDSDSYVLEAGDQYLRFYRDGGQILSTAAIANGTFTSGIGSWTNTSTGTGSISHDAGNERMAIAGGASGVGRAVQGVQFLGVGNYTLTFTVATGSVVYKIGTTSGGSEIATGTGTVGVNNINFAPTSAGTVFFTFENSNNDTRHVDTISINNPIYEINTPWTDTELAECDFAQVFDSMYIVHPNHAPRKLTRTGHAQWTLSRVVFDDGPYYDITDAQYGGRGTGFTLTIAGSTSVGSSVTVTASSPLFASTDVGRLIRRRTLTTDVWGVIEITGFTSNTVVTGTVVKALSGTSASSQWRLGAFSNTTGWPSAITFHEQRMVLARTRTQQQTIWFSEAGNLTGFSPDNAEDKDEVDADTAMTYTISDNKANVIYYLVPQRGLYIISSGGVWLARASSQGEAITPETINISPILTEAAARVKPIVVGANSFYANKYRRKIMEVGYSFQDDAFKANDIAMLAEHRTEGNIAQIAVARSPNYLVWIRKQDGTLSTCTFVKEQNVNAWAEQELGGTDVAVEQLVSVPGVFDDEVWMIVSRTIDGVTRKYIEYLSPSRVEQDIDNAKFVDCSISYNGTATTTLTGADHLEGEEVQCLGDGAVVVASPVDSGSIDLQSSVETAVVGLPYTSVIHTSQLVSGNAPAALQGRLGRIHTADIRLYNSYGGEIGYDAGNLDTMPEYSSTTIMGDPLIMFEGDKEFLLPSEYSRNPRMYIKHSLPTPFNLLSITYKASVSSR